MKILKIFGLVVGIHVVAFMFVFAIPGCRSTSRHSPRPGSLDTAGMQGGAVQPPADSAGPIASSPVGGPVDHALNPATAPAPSTSYDPGPAPVVRFNPTRPGAAPGVAAANADAGESSNAVTHTVVSGDTLWKIARQYNLSVKELASANKIRADVPLRQGQKLVVPGKAVPMSTGAAPSVAGASDTLTYTVKPGDTLGSIARRSGTTAGAIKSLNNLRTDTVRVGQELTLPAGATAAAALAATPEATPARTSGGQVKHTVKPGENLGIIAKRYGVSRRELSVANHIADPLKLRAGQELIIPNPKSVPAAPAEEPAPAADPMNQPAVETVPNSPIAPASGPESSPIAAPVNEVAPPVIEVQDANSPVAAPNS